MGRGRLVGADSERLTFRDMIVMLRDDYKVQGNKSLDRAERAIRNPGDFFGLSRALDITTDQITRYIVARQDVQIAPATTAYELAILKRMFTVAIKAEKLDRRPHIPHIEVRNVRSSFFSESEFRKVLTFLHADVQPVVEFCYLTGWRIREVRPLRWTQIDWNEKTIRLQPGTTKNDEGRIFPFSRVLKKGRKIQQHLSCGNFL